MKCWRRRVVREMMLLVILSLVFLGIWHLVAEGIPVVSSIRITQTEIWRLPFPLSRWLHVLTVPIGFLLTVSLVSKIGLGKGKCHRELLHMGLIVGIGLGGVLHIGLLAGIGLERVFGLAAEWDIELAPGLLGVLVPMIAMGTAQMNTPKATTNEVLDCVLVAGVGYTLAYGLFFGPFLGLAIAANFILVYGLIVGIGWVLVRSISYLLREDY